MELTEAQGRELKRIVERYDLNLVVLFGSRSRGRVHGASDTDLAVRGKSPFDVMQLAELAREFDAVFPESEVCDVRQAPPVLLAAIARDGISLHQQGPHDFALFKISAFNQFWDFMPTLKRLREETRRDMGNW